MNKEILMVMKWLENSDLVTQGQLTAAHNRAKVAYCNELADSLESGHKTQFIEAVRKTDNTYCVQQSLEMACMGLREEASKMVDVYFIVCSDISMQIYIEAIKRNKG